VNGVNYHFIDREEFQRRIDEGGFLEYTTYCDNYYGTPLKEAIAVLESGKNLILEIECDGAKNVKKIFPDAVLIMLIPPTFAIQEERLRGRGTETESRDGGQGRRRVHARILVPFLQGKEPVPGKGRVISGAGKDGVSAPCTALGRGDRRGYAAGGRAVQMGE
jgi:hypothetical protein